MSHRKGFPATPARPEAPTAGLRLVPPPSPALSHTAPGAARGRMGPHVEAPGLCRGMAAFLRHSYSSPRRAGVRTPNDGLPTNSQQQLKHLLATQPAGRIETAEARSDRIARLHGGTRVPGARSHTHGLLLSAGRGRMLHAEQVRPKTTVRCHRGRQWGRRKQGDPPHSRGGHGGDGAPTLEQAGSAAVGVLWAVLARLVLPRGSASTQLVFTPLMPGTPPASHSGAPPAPLKAACFLQKRLRSKKDIGLLPWSSCGCSPTWLNVAFQQPGLRARATPREGHKRPHRNLHTAVCTRAKRWAQAPIHTASG